jgi:hypothetical protein
MTRLISGVIFPPGFDGLLVENKLETTEIDDDSWWSGCGTSLLRALISLIGNIEETRIGRRQHEPELSSLF